MSKPFTHTLALLQGGAFNDKCGALLAEVVQGVADTGKAGFLLVRVEVKPAGGAVQVSAKATNKAPEEQADADLFWPTVEGNLSIDNPAQRKAWSNLHVVSVRVLRSLENLLEELDAKYHCVETVEIMLSLNGARASFGMAQVGATYKPNKKAKHAEPKA